MKTYVIRPLAAISRPMQIEAISMTDAMVAFSNSIGLLVVKSILRKAGTDDEHLEFLMGNDRTFFTYPQEN
jgi:hypothetical protein